ncbi:MAG: hypothetical protein IM574_04810 [Cytophagales bacterium]|nr:hypothetical protein [Cytophagales bacterium]
MNLAIKNPATIGKLIVVDIAPKSYPVHHDHILEGLTSIPIATLASRTEADKILSEYVPEPDVRQFLLKNLSRNGEGKFEWKINLASIQNHIEEIGMGMRYIGVFEKPTLFINGARSNYFKSGDEVLVKSLFPAAQIATIDASHWVQAEKPEEFVQVVLNFLKN